MNYPRGTPFSFSPLTSTVVVLTGESQLTFSGSHREDPRVAPQAIRRTQRGFAPVQSGIEHLRGQRERGRSRRHRARRRV